MEQAVASKITASAMFNYNLWSKSYVLSGPLLPDVIPVSLA